LARLLVRAEWVKSNQKPILLDQGCLQGLWSLYLSAGETDIDPERLAPLVRSLYEGVDTRILYIDVAPALAAKRIASRLDGHSRLDGRPEKEIEQMLEQSVRLAQSILCAARLAGLSAHVVPGDRSVEELQRALRVIASPAGAAKGRMDVQRTGF
jgi:hypothetical protein